MLIMWYHRDLKAQSEVHLWVGSKLALAGEQVFQSKENLSFPPPSNFNHLQFPKKEMTVP